MTTQWWAALGAAAVVLATAVGTARRLLLVVTVRGASMEPGLHDGDRVLVLRRNPERLRAQEVVVLRGPLQLDTPAAPLHGGPVHFVIKRLAAVAGQSVPPAVRHAVADAGSLVPLGSLVVLGDNPDHSSDSRDFGPVPAARAVGTVVHRFRAAADG